MRVHKLGKKQFFYNFFLRIIKNESSQTGKNKGKGNSLKKKRKIKMDIFHGK